MAQTRKLLAETVAILYVTQWDRSDYLSAELKQSQRDKNFPLREKKTHVYYKRNYLLTSWRLGSKEYTVDAMIRLRFANKLGTLLTIPLFANGCISTDCINGYQLLSYHVSKWSACLSTQMSAAWNFGIGFHWDCHVLTKPMSVIRMLIDEVITKCWFCCVLFSVWLLFEFPVD